MSRSVKKGPFVDEKLLKKIEAVGVQRQKKTGHQDLVSAFDDNSGYGWAHYCCS